MRFAAVVLLIIGAVLVPIGVVNIDYLWGVITLAIGALSLGIYHAIMWDRGTDR